MSSLAGITQGSVGLASQLNEATGFANKLVGDTQKVHFLQGGNTVFSLDCCLNESHARDSTPTTFPLEGSETISDHIIVGPLTLDLTGIISDYPLRTPQSLAVEGIASAVSTTGALGLVASGSAYALYTAIQNNTAEETGQGSNQPSVKAFAQLLKLQAGDPTANPPVLPQPFDVKTKLHLYTNMVIKNLSVPRDATTGAALVFSVSLQQLLIVAPQSVNVQIFADAGLAAEKANIGEQEAKKRNALLDGATFTDKGFTTLTGGTPPGGTAAQIIGGGE